MNKSDSHRERSLSFRRVIRHLRRDEEARLLLQAALSALNIPARYALPHATYTDSYKLAAAIQTHLKETGES